MYKRVWWRLVPKTEGNATEDWDTIFSSIYWDRLHLFSKTPNASVIVAYLEAIANLKDKDMLDVGCAEGLLLNFAKIDKKQKQREYLDVDLSELGGERAASRPDEIHFEIMSIEDARLHCWVVMLNTCVCFLKDLEEVTTMLVDCLQENGYMIVSLCLTPQSKKMWKTFSSDMKMIDMADVTSVEGCRWRVGLFARSAEN